MSRPYVSLRPASRFREVYRAGRRASAGPVRVVVAPGGGALPEVGVVAGRSVGNAVRRNRAKRRLREAMAGIELRPDRAYVAIASPPVVDLGFGELVACLERATAAATGPGRGPGADRSNRTKEPA